MAKKKQNNEEIKENILEINYEDEMKQAYIDYAMSVIVQRALPDVRDGLKPVHRRILYAMNGIDNFPNKPHKKSARITGETLGKYHPHSDVAIYDSMVRMAQDFSLNHPLVDGHGNFGSIDGDGAASLRYTEARLTPLALELLQNLEKNVVEFKPNFDNTTKEPIVLPAKFPNLLVNGSTGIAVGMSTSIPPHNFEESVMAVIDHLENADSDPLKRIKGPDFPTGGIIVNKDELKDIYRRGSGKIKVRARLEVEDIGYGRKNIVVTEIPYTFSGSKTQLIENIINLANERKLDELTDVRDESSMSGLRIVLEVKKGINVDKLIKKLYAKTKLEDTFGVNLLAVENNIPKTYSLKEMVASYTNFLKDINRKQLEFDLNKAKSREEIIQGYMRAVDVIDLIIEIIRNSKDVATVKKCLIVGDTKGINFKTKKSEQLASKLLFSEAQADAILGMQLQRLVGLEMEKLLKEEKELSKTIERITKILQSENLFNEYIKEDLLRVLKLNKRNRKTEIIQTNGESYDPEPEVIEDYYILIDRLGYIKTVDEQSIAKAGEDTLQEYKTILKAKNTDTLLVFSKDSYLQQIKVRDIAYGKLKDKGIPIERVVNDTNYIAMMPLETESSDILMSTKSGMIKRVERNEFNFNRKESYSTKLDENDEIISIHEIKDEDHEISLITSKENKLRFLLSEVPVQKRNARGVIAVRMDEDEEMVAISIEGNTKEPKRRRGAKGKR